MGDTFKGSLILISRKATEICIHTLRDYISEHDGVDPSLEPKMKALRELETSLGDWKDIECEVPPASARGSRVQVKIEQGTVYNAFIMACPDNGGDVIFSRLGSHEDDILFNDKVKYWRYDG